MKTEALNCPNCGAAVSSDSAQCRFCRSRLKTVGCPSCFGLMFQGAKFCPHCGVKAVAAEIKGAADFGRCPRCGTKLNSLTIAETDLRECEKCDGLWADVETFENICADRERRAAVLTFTTNRTLPNLDAAKIKYVPCPDCKQLMNRSNFARASGVIIDICKQHGIWFDAEELPKIIEFIQKGGLDMARQKEKLEISDQRNRLREEERRQILRDRRFDTGRSADFEHESGIRSFINLLFE